MSRRLLVMFLVILSIAIVASLPPVVAAEDALPTVADKIAGLESIAGLLPLHLHSFMWKD